MRKIYFTSTFSADISACRSSIKVMQHDPRSSQLVTNQQPAEEEKEEAEDQDNNY